jgi:hypothetical protein
LLGIKVNKKINKITIPAETNEPIIAPSQLFLGEMIGAILCLPNNTPAKYAAMSHPTTEAMRIRIVVQ